MESQSCRVRASVVLGDRQELWFIRVFGGATGERDKVRLFHPERMSAISRGLSVRDTPGAKGSKWDWHPEGMLAGSPCQTD